MASNLPAKQSERSAVTPTGGKSISPNKSFISRSEKLLDKLEFMMDGVTKSECTPETVRAATECADKAIQLMKLNFEAHKFAAQNGAFDGKSDD